MTQFKVKLRRVRVEETEVLVDADKVEVVEEKAIKKAKENNLYWSTDNKTNDQIKVSEVVKTNNKPEKITPEMFYG